MVRPWLASALPSVLFSAPLYAAEPADPGSTATTQQPTLDVPPSVVPNGTARVDVGFEVLVRAGDHARLAGRLDDAVAAYLAALDIRPDGLVSGRLGLILLQISRGAPALDVHAARHLHRAISEASGATAAERKQFFEAYEKVRRRICQLDVVASHADAMIAVGEGKPEPSNGQFWVFIGPGAHAIRGTLEGHEDIRTTVECVKGEHMEVQLDFVPLPAPPAPPPEVPEERTVVIREAAVREPAVREPSPAPREMPRASAEHAGRLSGALGAVLVFGASPEPALGPSITGAYQWGIVSVMGNVRGAWSLGWSNGREIGVFVLTGQAGPCVQWGWLGGCAAASINMLQHEVSDDRVFRSTTVGQIIPGVSLGISAQHRVTRRITARLSGDFTVLTRDLSVGVPNVSTVWDGGRMLGSVTLALVISQ